MLLVNLVEPIVLPDHLIRLRRHILLFRICMASY
jgi:hypothetical protein